MCIRSEQLLRRDWLDTYNRGLDLLWSQAVEINSNLYLLDKITHFPFHIFVPMPTDQLCWRLIVKALYESCLMGIWRIVTDSGSDVLTLRRFKNELMKNAHDSAKHLICKRLKAVDFDKRVADVEGVIRELRNNWLAHLKEEVVVSAYVEGKGMPVIPLDRLKGVCNAVNELIDALSFDSGRGFIYLEYSDAVMHSPGRDSRSDIEKLLDCVAQSSPIFSMPEDEPEFWRIIRSDFSEEDLAMFNKYRVKIGLPPA